MYGGNAYGSVPYAGGSGAAEVVVVVPAHDDLLGRVRKGRALLTVDVPVAAVPAGVTLATRVDKALAYPTPVLVDGRPT